MRGHAPETCVPDCKPRPSWRMLASRPTPELPPLLPGLLSGSPFRDLSFADIVESQFKLDPGHFDFRKEGINLPSQGFRSRGLEKRGVARRNEAKEGPETDIPILTTSPQLLQELSELLKIFEGHPVIAEQYVEILVTRGCRSAFRAWAPSPEFDAPASET